ncbi:MAG: hypothetical protein QXD24_07770 [Candidatus Caldarchaeum sp.]
MSARKNVLKVLPSLPPSAFSSLFPSFCIQVSSSSLDELAADAKKYDKVIVYVRHAPTLKLLRKWLLKFTVGDIAEVGEELFYVLSAPQRASVSGKNIPDNEKNLMVLRCVGAKGVWL